MSKKNRATKKEKKDATDKMYIVSDLALGMANGELSAERAREIVDMMETSKGFSVVMPRCLEQMIRRRHSVKEMPRPEGMLSFNDSRAYNVYEMVDAVLAYTG
jgi:hypothetical protein